MSGYCSPDNIRISGSRPRFIFLGKGFLPQRNNPFAAFVGTYSLRIAFPATPATGPNAAAGHPDAPIGRNSPPVTKTHQTMDGIATLADKGEKAAEGLLKRQREQTAEGADDRAPSAGGRGHQKTRALKDAG